MIRVGALAIAGAVVLGLVACASGPADDCPEVPGMAAIALVPAEFGLDGDLPAHRCDYEDVTGTYSPDDRFVIAVWREPPAGIGEAVAAIAEASGFRPEAAHDPQFAGGGVIAWRDAGFSGAVIVFDDLPVDQAPAGYAAFAGKPLAWVGLHAPRERPPA